ncbi:hypothetical protein [Actinacidiphila sp. ITFR-21]|uniref:hypothetical protein n=1 Tax=Actinacidiphila sp. ITFR-21 TaxID=3075199 RepID=UPI00288BDCE3|nr:hypothetical protein [Streptomyces sp. ITFR-21]WNI17660.1 hypothetical protein RLT57_20435 [Streptomyces sp. ITFR-21]WNI17800.1 hypothetical protein RLT57_21150 [Streptomyces sp. ITFR-21]
MAVDPLCVVSLGPSGVPCTYGLDGQPVTLREATWLMAGVERRTLYSSSLRLATGEWVTVRTLGLVFDPDAATEMVVAEGYRPPVWGTALYTPAPQNALLEVLCTYSDPDEAVREHKEAMSMIAVGLNEADAEPRWAGRLSWAGPES